MKKLRISVLLAIVIITCSCQFIPVNQLSDGEVHAPSEEPEVQAPVGEQSFSTVTDSNGQATLIEEDTKVEIQVQVIDQADQKPIPNIDVTFLTKNGQTIAILQDPNGKYLPYVVGVSSSQSSITPGKMAKTIVQSPNQLPILLMIKLYTAYQAIQNIREWYEYLSSIPEIQNWSEETNEICLNSDQVTQGARNLLGSSLIMLSFATDPLFPKDDIVVQGLKLVSEELRDDAAHGILSGLLVTQQPQITRWKIYKINETLPYFIRPEGYCLEPFEKNSLHSAIEWVKYGIEQDDMYVMDIMAGDKVAYVNYIEGGDSNFKDEFLSDLEERSGSQPDCRGIMTHDEVTTSIWFENWEPLWEMTEMCYEDCWTFDTPATSNIVGFFLGDYQGQGYQIYVAWINVPDIFPEVYDYEMRPCNSTSQDSSNEETIITSCPNAPDQRMIVGQNGYVCTKKDGIYLRSEPSKSGATLKLLGPGTQFSIIGGPKCANNWSYWQVKLSDGTTGWVSEGGDSVDPYFICPAD